MRVLIALVGLIAAVNAVSVSFDDNLNEEWKTFKLTHKKEYKNYVEEEFRKKIYLENKQEIAEHNQKYEQGLVSFKLGVNKFADLLHDEFKNIMTGYNRNRSHEIDNESGVTFIPPANVNAPSSIDWRDAGAVTPVKDQGGCGSCWAFSATGSLEGQQFRKSGQLISLSEQNLIDCSSSYGNSGCGGGNFNQAFSYIKDNGGIDTEESYPYLGIDDTCKFDEANIGATVTGFTTIRASDEGDLMEAVATIGPVSVSVDASQNSFQLYSAGIYDEANCNSETTNHSVLVVGYGTEDGTDYWLVKNSWGTGWGEEGYIRMSRNKNNQCGIANRASYPLV